jgi:hypothetical protein
MLVPGKRTQNKKNLNLNKNVSTLGSCFYVLLTVEGEMAEYLGGFAEGVTVRRSRED